MPVSIDAFVLPTMLTLHSRAVVVEYLARLPVDAALRVAAAREWSTVVNVPLDEWEMRVIGAGIRRLERALNEH